MAAPAAGRSRRGLSLEHKVPLLILGLLLVLLSVTIALSYRALQSAARVAGDERLDRISLQLVEIVQGSVTQRVAGLEAVAADPRVIALAGGGAAPDSAWLAPLLEPLAAPPEEELVAIVDDRGSILFDFGDSPGVRAATADAVEGAVDAGYRPLLERDGEYLTPAVAPIRRGDELLGYVLHLRPFANPAAAASISELLGVGASFYFVEQDNRWIQLAGGSIVAPTAGVPDGAIEYRRDGRDYLASAAPVPGTTWTIVTELPLDEVMEEPTAFLRRMAAVLLVVTLLGALASWTLSRGFTRPLRELGNAAGAIAAGDYSRRVELERTDELGMLADAFNSMAAQVQMGDAERQRQVNQARALADELEQTNRRLLELMEEAQAARQTAEAASRAKSDFLATVSHEIRTPINAIIGYTDLLLLGIPVQPAPEQMEQLERVRQSGKRLTRLVDDVLDLAKIESGHLEIREGTGVAEDTLRAVVSMTEPLAARKRLTLVTRLGGSRATTYSGDPGRVEQILLNLVGNAVKFTPADGRVVVRCETVSATDGEGGAVRFIVEDNGPGIPKDKQELIFDRFVQGDSGYRRSHEGAGLGLAISRELARLMGGDIVVRSEEGDGAIFILTLPLAGDRSRPPAGASAA